jgi:monofunctional biosynthetic peptidoglycan transglycosylase
MRVVRRIAALVAVGVLVFAAWLLLVWPPPSWWRTHWPEETAFMALRTHQYRAAHDTTSRRYRPIPLDSMSPWLGRAAIAGEDDAFYQHHGIDWRSVREALGYRREEFSFGNPRDRAELRRALSGAGGRRGRLRGASTITQQLAKNLYLSPSRNPLRKIKEAVITYRLEWALPKARILELYLNVAEFGPNLWGVEAASQRYFGRSAARLSMDQAALLVATLPHPLSSNPALRPGRTIWRQQLILRRLRGEPVIVPQEEGEPVAPAPVVDSAPAPRTDSAAAPAPKPDTTAVPPPTGPPPPR